MRCNNKDFSENVQIRAYVIRNPLARIRIAVKIHQVGRAGVMLLRHRIRIMTRPMFQTEKCQKIRQPPTNIWTSALAVAQVCPGT